MITGNYYEDNPDLRFAVDRWLDWGRVAELREQGFADARRYNESEDERFALAPSNADEALEGYRALLEQAGELAGKEIAPVAQKMNQTGLRYDPQAAKVHFPEDYTRLYKLMAESGLLSASVGRELGGMNAPLPVIVAMKEILTRADNSFEIAVAVSYLSEVLIHSAPESVWREYVPKIIAGELTGAMALTEPEYGSDLSHIKTKAIKQDDGTYRITGAKRFITHGCGVGDVPAFLLTLARTSGEDARGTSFFLVRGEDAKVAGIEHKLGLTCSPTCEMVFDESPAILLGKEGEGLVKHVIAMLNVARIGVATESVGVMQAAFEEARKYAGERIQFGRAIAEIPAVARMLREMDAITQAQRAIVLKTSELVEILEQTQGALRREGKNEKEIRKAPEVASIDRRAKLQTALAKLMCSEMANRVAYDALQVFGGAGFTEEYDIARIYRDARISTIYEGTTQIHTATCIAILGAGFDPEDSIRQYLEGEIDSVEDAGRQRTLRACLAGLEEVFGLYRKLERNERDYFARDPVFAFGFFFGLVLLASQNECVQATDDSEFIARKRQAFTEYARLTRAQIAQARAGLEAAVAEQPGALAAAT